MSPLLIGFIGLVVGILGTGAGGLITALTGKPKARLLSFYLGFAGGIMLAIVFGELIPEAIEESGLFVTLVGLLLGVGLLMILDTYLPHLHHGGNADGDPKFAKMGVLLGLGIAIHNLPEGVAIGAGFALDPSLGISLSLVLALHNIPEGIAVAVPLLAGGFSLRSAVLITALAGVPVGVGALLGALIAHVSPVFLALSLGFAAGAMLYISFDELLPEANIHSEGSHSGIYGGILGVIIGYVLIAVL